MNFKLSRKVGAGIMVLLITVCLIPSIARAFNHGDGMQDKRIERKDHHRSELGIWRNPKLVQILELSKEQVKELRDADFISRENCLELKAELDSLHLKMDKAFSEDSVDKKAVLSLAKQISDAKGKLFVQKIEARLTVGNILTKDQITMLKLHHMDHKKPDPKK